MKSARERIDYVSEATAGDLVVLQAGEETAIGGGRIHAPASIVLARGRTEKGLFYTLIDTGFYGQKMKIREMLAQTDDLTPEDIEQVILTHTHPDHAGNIGLFRNAEVFSPDSIYSVSRPDEFDLIAKKFWKNIKERLYPQDANLEIIPTPGHSGLDVSVLWQYKDMRVLAAGDLFWSEEDWRKDNEFLGLCVNPAQQRKRRSYIKKVIKPNIVIPGHGLPFVP